MAEVLQVLRIEEEKGIILNAKLFEISQRIWYPSTMISPLCRPILVVANSSGEHLQLSLRIFSNILKAKAVWR